MIAQRPRPHTTNRPRHPATLKPCHHPLSSAERYRPRVYVSSGLRPIPPPCLGCRLEASWMFVGISWEAFRGPLGGSFEASWGPSGGLLGSLFGPLVGLVGPLGASWGLLEASWGLLGASSSGSLELSVRVPPLGPLLGPSRRTSVRAAATWLQKASSWGHRGLLLAHLGPTWSHLGPSRPVTCKLICTRRSIFVRCQPSSNFKATDKRLL